MMPTTHLKPMPMEAFFNLPVGGKFVVWWAKDDNPQDVRFNFEHRSCAERQLDSLTDSDFDEWEVNRVPDLKSNLYDTCRGYAYFFYPEDKAQIRRTTYSLVLAPATLSPTSPLRFSELWEMDGGTLVSAQLVSTDGKSWPDRYSGLLGVDPKFVKSGDSHMAKDCLVTEGPGKPLELREVLFYETLTVLS